MYSLAGVFIACFLMQDRYHRHYGLLSSNTHGSQARIQKVLSKWGGGGGSKNVDFLLL